MVEETPGQVGRRQTPTRRKADRHTRRHTVFQLSESDLSEADSMTAGLGVDLGLVAEGDSLELSPAACDSPPRVDAMAKRRSLAPGMQVVDNSALEARFEETENDVPAGFSSPAAAAAAAVCTRQPRSNAQLQPQPVASPPPSSSSPSSSSSPVRRPRTRRARKVVNYSDAAYDAQIDEAVGSQTKRRGGTGTLSAPARRAIAAVKATAKRLDAERAAAAAAAADDDDESQAEPASASSQPTASSPSAVRLDTSVASVQDEPRRRWLGKMVRKNGTLNGSVVSYDAVENLYSVVFEDASKELLSPAQVEATLEAEESLLEESAGNESGLGLDGSLSLGSDSTPGGPGGILAKIARFEKVGFAISLRGGFDRDFAYTAHVLVTHEC
jgi:hypothetical protein